MRVGCEPPVGGAGAGAGSQVAILCGAGRVSMALSSWGRFGGRAPSGFWTWSIKVSLDFVRIGWGVLLIPPVIDSALPFFRFGDADLSSHPGGALLLCPEHGGTDTGEPTVDGGVTMQSSG